MSIVLVGASIYLILSLVGDIDDRLKPTEKDIFHEYSGIHPELYKKYLELKAEKKYADAIKTIEELALYASSDIMEEIHEKLLKQESLFI
jgi:hypothetical protein